MLPAVHVSACSPSSVSRIVDWLLVDVKLASVQRYVGGGYPLAAQVSIPPTSTVRSANMPDIVTFDVASAKPQSTERLNSQGGFNDCHNTPAASDVDRNEKSATNDKTLSLANRSLDNAIHCQLIDMCKAGRVSR